MGSIGSFLCSVVYNLCSCTFNPLLALSSILFSFFYTYNYSDSPEFRSQRRGRLVVSYVALSTSCIVLHSIRSWHCLPFLFIYSDSPEFRSQCRSRLIVSFEALSTSCAV